jgi:hypothetical protein
LKSIHVSFLWLSQPPCADLLFYPSQLSHGDSILIAAQMPVFALLLAALPAGAGAWFP